MLAADRQRREERKCIAMVDCEVTDRERLKGSLYFEIIIELLIRRNGVASRFDVETQTKILICSHHFLARKGNRSPQRFGGDEAISR